MTARGDTNQDQRPLEFNTAQKYNYNYAASSAYKSE